MSNRINDLLADGSHVAYCPLSGDLGVLDTECRNFKDITIEEFSEARVSNKIYFDRTTKCHGYFHGRVDIYKLSLTLPDPA